MTVKIKRILTELSMAIYDDKKNNIRGDIE